MSNISTALSHTDIEFGKRLWCELRDNRRFPVRGMFWLLEEGSWRLVIASDVVSKVGPRDAYRKMDEVVRLVPTDSYSSQLLRIKLISPENAVYEALQSVFAKTASVEGARLGGSQVGGMYIEDAYLYGVR